MKSVVIAGRLAKDAVLRRTQSGDPILGFSVAVDDGYGEAKQTMWFDCSVFGKRGQSLESMLTKGTLVTVSGDLGQREYESKKYLTVSVSNVTLQGGGERREKAYKEPKKGSSASAEYRTMQDDLDGDSIPF